MKEQRSWEVEVEVNAEFRVDCLEFKVFLVDEVMEVKSTGLSVVVGA